MKSVNNRSQQKQTFYNLIRNPYHSKQMAFWSDSASPETKRILIILMIINVVLNYFWRHQLFNLGQNIIYDLQQYECLPLNLFFYAFTLLIDPVVVLVGTFILMIVVRNKYRAFVSVMFLLLNTYFTGLLKAFYADPRPFWAHKHIDSIGFYCPQEYGNPSGHSWFAVVIAFSVIIEFWGLGKRFEYLCAALAIMIFVPMSRMYLGAHSLNQVMQGLFLGFIMIFFFKFCGLKQQLQSYLKNFYSQPNKKWFKLIIIMHVLYILSFFINEADINPYHKPIPKKWINNIRNKCNKEVDTNHLNFMMLMVNSILVNVSTGIGIGFKELIKSRNGKVYLSGKWRINTEKHGFWIGSLNFYLIQLGHLIAGFIPAVFLVYLFGPKHWMLFVFCNIGAFISGYVYTAKTYRTLFKSGVIVKTGQKIA